jgi:hypothetical protein
VSVETVAGLFLLAMPIAFYVLWSLSLFATGVALVT